MPGSDMTPAERRTRDLEKFRWSGVIHLGNVDAVAAALHLMLHGTMFSVAMATATDGIVPLLHLMSSRELDRDGVHVREGSDWRTLTVSAWGSDWNVYVDQDGPRLGCPEPAMDPYFNRPFGRFARKDGAMTFTVIYKALCGDRIVRTFAVETDRYMDLVEEVMEA